MGRKAHATQDATLPLEGEVVSEKQATETKAVATRDPKRGQVAQAQPPVSEAMAFMQMIERAITNPAVDVDKLDKLLQVKDRVEAQHAEKAFNLAMAAAQNEMEPVRTDAKNGSTSSKYATYAALDRAVRPIYTKHGIALSFNTEDVEGDAVRVVCYVTGHGHTRIYRITMPADGKGARGGDVMTKTHATGSAASYGMRYLLKMIFNIATYAEDDDGNKAGRVQDDKPRLSQKQIDELIEACEAAGLDRKEFLAFGRVERFEDIYADKFNVCMAAIKERGANK